MTQDLGAVAVILIVALVLYTGRPKRGGPKRGRR